MALAGTLGRWTLVAAAVLSPIVACGHAEKSGGGSGEANAGESGLGGTTGGSGQEGGTSGAGTGGSDGGEPSEGGAPSGGSGGTTPGGSGGSASGATGAGTAGAAGAAGVRIPDGCAPVSQHVGGTFCSAEMTCDSRRLNVSCSQVSAQLWSCSCLEGQNRVDFEFPDATGVVTCEAAAKACADPDIVTGDPTCVRERTMGVLACAIHDTCDRVQEVDGVTLRLRTVWDASCEPCENPQSYCCHCASEKVVDQRVRDIDLSRGCDFLDALCSGDDLEQTGPLTCETLDEHTYPDEICSNEVLCGQPVALDSGTTLTLSERYTTWCYARTEGLRCTCANESGVNTFAVDYGNVPVSLGPCRGASAACSGLEPIEYTAARRCTPTIDVFQEGGCIFYVDCTRPATIRGEEVTVYSQVGSQCELQADGSFTCYCNNRTAGPYRIEAEDSASACPMANEICPTLSPSL